VVCCVDVRVLLPGAKEAKARRQDVGGEHERARAGRLGSSVAPEPRRTSARPASRGRRSSRSACAGRCRHRAWHPVATCCACARTRPARAASRPPPPRRGRRCGCSSSGRAACGAEGR
jgi:hypothetical protein